MKAAFTGHRPESLPYSEDSQEFIPLLQAIWTEIDHLIEMGVDTFYCGAARGSDIICGEDIVFRKTLCSKPFTLICSIPFKEQPRGWELEWKMRYWDLLKNSDRIVQTSDRYQRGCYHIRNRYLVDHSDILLAIYDGYSSGGTAYTINYAKKTGKPIIIIDPHSLSITKIPL